MKNNRNILKILLFLVFCLNAQAQDFSFSGYLDKKVSISFTVSSITDSVHELMNKMKNDDSSFEGVNFEFIGSDIYKFTKPHKIILNNEKLREVINQFSSIYKHSVRYDYGRNVIVFSAVKGSGKDPQRAYFVTDETSNKLKLNWQDQKKFTESLFNYGVVANIESVDLVGRKFTASSSLANLDHIDMLIDVFSRIPVKKAN